MVSSALLWGFIADAFGRRNLLIYGYFADAACNLLSGTTKNFYSLIAFKYISGFMYVKILIQQILSII